MKDTRIIALFPQEAVANGNGSGSPGDPNSGATPESASCIPDRNPTFSTAEEYADWYPRAARYAVESGELAQALAVDASASMTRHTQQVNPPLFTEGLTAHWQAWLNNKLMATQDPLYGPEIERRLASLWHAYTKGWAS